jgi:integrase/recombinase XerC
MDGLLLTNALTEYKDFHLAARSFSLRSRREYVTDLQQLVDYLQGIKVLTVQQVERRHLEGFLAHLDRQALSNTTRRRKLSVLRSFFRFLQESGRRKGNPAQDVIPPALDVSAPRYLTQQEYERLRRAVRHDPRDAALIELLLQTGLRLSEVCGLRLGDVELPDRRQPGQATGKVRVWHGRRHRLVSLNTKACEAVRGYLLVRSADAQDDKLFQSKFRRGMGPRSIEDAVSKYLRGAGSAVRPSRACATLSRSTH